ncbi:MAG: twin-arginine translocase TatA/TatE family subunit [Bacteroidales bacterium]|nr:twin-arginine translocase TatA/TatE family subunit [Bacteroidales bacterium]MBN2817572.1 twin-arginine translocase TatA/TatE family subunit [Bacteroidales bacterium]
MVNIVAFSPGPTEIILIILAILILFGGKKIPELMKGLGQGMKEFKKASKEDPEESKPDDSKKSIKEDSGV